MSAVKRRVALSDLETTLRGVLGDLSMSDDRRKPWVVVRDTLTERFVQFATIVGTAVPPHRLLVDIPEGPAFPEEARPVLAALELRRARVTIPIDPDWTWQSEVTPSEGARLAAAVFVGAFLAGDTCVAAFEIEEGGNKHGLN